ncbi:hypothetical protein OIV83_004041 [Microbotryomycetes sp. JL201]|nr:hypothetical protein OIV83_004041 [Microbotryomycetes sp. JL201]
MLARTRAPIAWSALAVRLAPPSAAPFTTSLRSMQQQQHQQQNKSTPIGQIDRRLQITFTCTAPVPMTTTHTTDTQTKPCHHRSTHEFSKKSYEKGIVLVECPACQNRHLIADNLGWFSSTPSTAHPQGLPIGTKQPRTIEDLMREKGEQVRWSDGGDQGKTWEVSG